MPHEIEYKDGRYSFAFMGDRSAIWHRRGQQALESWSIDDWMRESGQSFTVRKVRLKGFDQAGEYACESHMGLIREDTGAMLSVVSPDWQPAQNADAYAFMGPLIEAGFCRLDTAGVLFEGRRCFVLAKTREGFQLPGGDDTEGYIPCQISHEYGIADLVLPTSVRVVCNNTLQFALEKKSREQLNAGRFVHRAKTAFSDEKAQALIEAYRLGLGAYAETARFLSSRQARPEQIRAYINKVFELEGTREQIEARRKHNEQVVAKLLETIETQPGAELSRGSLVVGLPRRHLLGGPWPLAGQGRARRLQALRHRRRAQEARPRDCPRDGTLRAETPMGVSCSGPGCRTTTGDAHRGPRRMRCGF